MPKRGLGTWVAVFAVIAVCVVALIGVMSLPHPETRSGTASGSKTSGGGATQATFLYRTMPKEFAVGGYKFYIGYNGTDFFYTVNGTATQNLGFNFELIVSNGSINQTTVFGWAPPSPQRGVLPTPDSAALFGGALQLDWSTNSTGTYLSISTSQTTSSTEAAADTTTMNSSTFASSGVSSNVLVATVTSTTTLTMQASQPTTTYAEPTTNCTLLGGAVTTTETVTTTYGASSTTSVTVTTTSISYTQTVTLTSCTYVEPTVTSTVTTTVALTSLSSLPRPP